MAALVGFKSAAKAEPPVMEGTYSETEIGIQSSSETAARCWDFGGAGFLLLVGNVINTDLT